MKLSELFSQDTIIPQLQAATREAVLEELLDVLIHTGRLEATARQQILQALLQREDQGSTGFGKGVAVPHCQHPAMSKTALAFGRSVQGLDFKALDGGVVYSVFLLLSPRGDQDGHLQAMELIFRNLQSSGFRKLLRQPDVAKKLMEFVAEDRPAEID